MIKAAYDAHRLLMFLYVLFRSSLDRFDPSAWADGVEVAMIGRRVRCEPVENLDQNQLEDFQITLEGATAILELVDLERRWQTPQLTKNVEAPYGSFVLKMAVGAEDRGDPRRNRDYA